MADVVAEPVAVAGEDGDAEPGWDGEFEPVGEVDPDGEDEAVPAAEVADEVEGEGAVGVRLELVPDTEALGDAEVEEEDGEGEVGGDFFGGCGVRLGLGVGVAEAGPGSATHEVSVLAPELALGLGLGLLLGVGLLLGLALLVLVLVLGLGEDAVSFTPFARAVPGSPASTPRVREPPASTLTTATRRCARRMKTALSSLLIEVLCALRVLRRRRGDGWV